MSEAPTISAEASRHQPKQTNRSPFLFSQSPTKSTAEASQAARSITSHPKALHLRKLRSSPPCPHIPPPLSAKKEGKHSRPSEATPLPAGAPEQPRRHHQPSPVGLDALPPDDLRSPEARSSPSEHNLPGSGSGPLVAASGASPEAPARPLRRQAPPLHHLPESGSGRTPSSTGGPDSAKLHPPRQTSARKTPPPRRLRSPLAYPRLRPHQGRGHLRLRSNLRAGAHRPGALASSGPFASSARTFVPPPKATRSHLRRQGNHAAAPPVPSAAPSGNQEQATTSGANALKLRLRRSSGDPSAPRHQAEGHPKPPSAARQPECFSWSAPPPARSLPAPSANPSGVRAPRMEQPKDPSASKQCHFLRAA